MLVAAGERKRRTVGGLRPLLGEWYLFSQLWFCEEWEKAYRMFNAHIPVSLFVQMSENPLALSLMWGDEHCRRGYQSPDSVSPRDGPGWGALGSKRGKGV